MLLKLKRFSYNCNEIYYVYVFVWGVVIENLYVYWNLLLLFWNLELVVYIFMLREENLFFM